MGRGRGHSPSEALATALVALRGADENDLHALRQAVDEATDEIEAALADRKHFSQSEAARLLGVSSTTLENWVAKGLLPLRRVRDYKRPRVPAKPLIDLAAEVKELRRMGRKRGLLAEALARLEREDPEWKKQSEELHAPLTGKSFKREDYVSAAPGADWDSED